MNNYGKTFFIINSQKHYLFDRNYLNSDSVKIILITQKKQEQEGRFGKYEAD